MPTLEPLVLLAVFVTVFVAGAGWTLGCFVMSALLAAFKRKPVQIAC